MSVASRRDLTRSSFSSIAIKVANVGLGFFVATALARLLGPSNFGSYTYALTLVLILSIPTRFGLANLLVRETASSRATQSWGNIRALWHWSSVSALLYQLVLGVVIVAVGAIISSNGSWQLAAWAALVALTGSLARVVGGALRGLGHVAKGQIADDLIRPLVFAILIVAGGVLSIDDASGAMAVHAVAASVGLTVALYWWRRHLPDIGKDAGIQASPTRRWGRALGLLALVGGMQQINQYADLMILGLFRPTAEVGLYRIAALGAGLIVLGLQAVTIAISPSFAGLHTRGETEALQRVVRFSAGLSLLLALGPFVFFVCFGKAMLAIVFGAEFQGSYWPLLILSAGQLLNAGCGSIGYLLNMTGYERETAKGVGVAAVLNLFLNGLLVPPFGMRGAAIATALSLLIWNWLLWRSARRFLGIRLVGRRR